MLQKVYFLTPERGVSSELKLILRSCSAQNQVILHRGLSLDSCTVLIHSTRQSNFPECARDQPQDTTTASMLDTYVHLETSYYTATTLPLYRLSRCDILGPVLFIRVRPFL